jgi:hypothetical protein
LRKQLNAPRKAIPNLSSCDALVWRLPAGREQSVIIPGSEASSESPETSECSYQDDIFFKTLLASALHQGSKVDWHPGLTVEAVQQLRDERTPAVRAEFERDLIEIRGSASELHFNGPMEEAAAKISNEALTPCSVEKIKVAVWLSSKIATADIAPPR